MSKETIQIALSAITAGCISGFGSIIVVVGAGYSITPTVVKLAVFIGVVQAAKDVRSMMHMPPVDVSSAAVTMKGDANAPAPKP